MYAWDLIIFKFFPIYTPLRFYLFFEILLYGVRSMKTNKSARNLTILVVLLSLTGLLLVIDVQHLGNWGFTHTSQIQELGADLTNYAQRFETVNSKVLTNAADRLQNLQHGTVLVDSNLIAFVLYLNAAILLISGLVLFTSRKENTGQAKDSNYRLPSEASDVNRFAFDSAIQDLQAATVSLSTLLNSYDDRQASKNQENDLEIQFENISRMNALEKVVSEEIRGVKNHILETVREVQRLCGLFSDGSALASANQVQWNSLGNKLRVGREANDKVKSIISKIGGVHQKATPHRTAQMPQL